MKEYRVVVASYSVELVEAESPEDACEIAMEIFEPTDEWVIAEVDEINRTITTRRNSMTTFTMQDLNNAVPTTHEQDEEFKQMENIGLKELLLDHLNAPEVPRETKEVLHSLVENRAIPEPTMQDIVDNIRLPNPDAIQYTHGGTLGAPEPQATPTLADIINNICTQLQLLTSVISQSKAQPEAGENSLQECVSLTLQQADWFKDLVRHELIGAGIEDLAKDAVQEVVESEVESYFENNFDPSYHFDFDDAVSDAVGDRIDDVVSDKIDGAVDSYLSNATISISK